MSEVCMDYHTWKLHKNRIVTLLCLISAFLLTTSICIIHWAKLTLPQHQYRPKIGDYIGPDNITSIYLGLFTTSHGSYYSLFKDVNKEEIRKVNIVASLLLVSVCSVLMAAATKLLAPRHCHLAKRYKGSALLSVLAAVLNIGSLVLWFWFTHGFTHGRSTLGAVLDFSYSVFIMLSSCGLLIIVIALEFISCRRRSHLDTDLVISPTPSEESDVAPLNMTPDPPDRPPPYQDLH
ncbi:uncharacterized protein LOC134825940 [Bolinopsis microptera]|uniref:uncharacterized protein LOC134825940 n=1 Tax=Bolinopsis microptera TaxID=2820187 RepID=UPI00307A37F7